MPDLPPRICDNRSVGVEPVWVQFLADAGIISASRYDLPVISRASGTEFPDWDGSAF